MHSEFLIDQSGKMSKSTGEFLTLSLLKSKGYLPLAYRFYCLGSHYRSKLNFSYESLDAAQQGYIGLIAKLRRLMAESKDLQVENEKLIAIRGKIKKIINNDLNSSETLAYLFTLLKDYSVNASTKIASLDVFDALLGLDLVESLKKIEKIEKVPEEVRQLVLERSKAKSEKNFVRADSIRLKIKELGYLIEDRKEGIKIKKG